MSTGDGTDLVAVVVAALVQAAGSAAGTALGAEAVGWVREGLGQLPRWSRAAERAEAAPRDDAARQDLAEAVGELLSLHPGLAESLAERWAQALGPVEAPPAPPVPPLPPAPTTVTVGDGFSVGGPGQAAVGVGNIVAGGDVHHDNRVNNVHKGGGAGLLVAVLVVVGAWSPSASTSSAGPRRSVRPPSCRLPWRASSAGRATRATG
ncbi:hypothetical protein ACFV0O_04800 [Kitasatospora sp. NPDC059577]|uniref:hypothetical protein n=1 Tax=Kitasatospora sp. NPDC059577 TaxID=3346873 RepID=UPI0036B2FD25